MRALLKTIIPCVLIIISINAQQDTGFTKRGTKWYGGSLSFASIGNELSDNRFTVFQIAPITRFFPADYFMLGPSISWTGRFSKLYDLQKLSFGMDIGGVLKTESLFPYFRSGCDLILWVSDNSSITGFSVPLAGEVIIPIGRIFAFQIEPSFTISWIEDVSKDNYISRDANCIIFCCNSP